MSSQQVIVGMSGGVDSSVSALLLKEQGYKVSALFMKNWEEDDTETYCAAEEDIKDAASVCERLGIDLKTVNFAFEYWERVFEQFLAEYQSGRTPNPDILCNREIKFKEFLQHAIEEGADYIATGHYARTRRQSGKSQLLRGLDRNKDQSYFLHAVTSDALDITLFPIGEIEKTQVRHLAEQHNFINHNKKDSTGICFIGKRKFREFLSEYLKPNPGDIVDEHDNKIGEHTGLMYYTLGQRQGLGIGGEGDAWFVAAKHLSENKLIAVQGHDHPLLFSTELTTNEHYFIAGTPPATTFSCTAKTRYRQDDFTVEVSMLDDGGMRVRYKDNPQRSVTPGQSLVLYDGEVCLGGTPIENTDANPIR